MHRGTHARRAEGQLVGVGLHVGDKLGNAPHWKAVVDHQQIGCGGKQRHRSEVLHHVVGHLGVERPVDGVGTHGGHHQGVGVGGGLRNRVGADVAAGTGLVLHHDRLSQLRLVTEDARQDVWCTTRRKGHHQLHRPGGPPWCLRALGLYTSWNGTAEKGEASGKAGSAYRAEQEQGAHNPQAGQSSAKGRVQRGNRRRSRPGHPGSGGATEARHPKHANLLFFVWLCGHHAMHRQASGGACRTLALPGDRCI